MSQFIQAVAQTMLTEANILNNAGYPAPLVALQTHLRHITDTALPKRDATAAALANTLGYHLDTIADYAAARPYFEQALEIWREVLGARHPDTSSSLNNLGYLLQAMGDYESARPYYEQALEIHREVLGARHPDTATSLNNLAILCYYQGDMAEAARLMRQAVAIYEAVLVPGHPLTVGSRESLGVIEGKAHTDNTTTD